MIKVNLSGHPVVGFEIAPLKGVNLEVGTGSALEAQIKGVLLALPCVEALKAGEAAEVVLPGMASACGVVLAAWHGLFGSFPTIRWSVKGASGFEWPESASSDLAVLRTSARTWR